MVQPHTIWRMARPLDICIRGGGIVGNSLALLLARENLRVGILTSPQREATQADVRCYALNTRSRALLDNLGCWPAPGRATDVLEMHVRGDQGAEVHFRASQLDVQALASIVEAAALESQLGDAVRRQTQIEILSEPRAAGLTVVCEGRDSSMRSELGIEFPVTPYGQTAIASRIECELAHGQTAHQWFSDGNILAFLPVSGALGKEMALVWSVSANHARTLMEMTPADFCQALEAATQGCLGRLSLTGPRQTWSLQKAQALRWVGTHGGQAWALAGDAAHTVHPLAGQGLNLGLADVQALTQVLKSREYWRPVGDQRLLRRYERQRKAEVLPVSSAMDGLQQLFGRNHQVWQSLRNWGMNGFEHCGPLKQWVARQAMGIS